MSFYNEIRIVNCEFTSIPASSFSNFGAVNYFSFEGGNMDSIDADALLGLNVIKDSTLPTPKGTFAMIDVDLVPGGLPTGWCTSSSRGAGAGAGAGQAGQASSQTGRQADRQTVRQTDASRKKDRYYACAFKEKTKRASQSRIQPSKQACW